MSALIDHARVELEYAFGDSRDEMDVMMQACLLSLIGCFAGQEHSGASAAMAISMFERLARFKPLTPLTGDDGEWIELQPALWQNRRCSSVFKTDERAYDINGRVFEYPDGSRVTRGASSAPTITFPYTPTTEVVKVPDNDDGDPAEMSPRS